MSRFLPCSFCKNGEKADKVEVSASEKETIIDLLIIGLRQDGKGYQVIVKDVEWDSIDVYCWRGTAEKKKGLGHFFLAHVQAVIEFQ